MNKKFYLLFIVIIFAVDSVRATSDLYNFVVWTNCGEQVKYSLIENPKVSHDGTYLVVTTSSALVQYAIADVSKFTIEESSPTTKNDGVVHKEAEIVNKGNVLYLLGFGANVKVVVSNMSGKCVYIGSTDKNGALSIDFSAYEVGMYIVSSNSINCKIIKK